MITGSSLMLANVFFAFEQSNISGKIIVLLLLAGSVVVWSIMLTKRSELQNALNTSLRFTAAYRKQGHPAALFLKRHNYETSPLFRLYTGCCEELCSCLEACGVNPDDLFMGAVGGARQKINSTQMSAVRGAVERSLSDQTLMLEEHMGLLATATTTAPFLGLLGTVWGVMDAFGGMAVKGTALLSEVAPGISGALITTVIGLMVALPSAIGYNLLNDKIRRIAVMNHNFARELISDIERHYLAGTNTQNDPH